MLGLLADSCLERDVPVFIHRHAEKVQRAWAGAGIFNEERILWCTCPYCAYDGSYSSTGRDRTDRIFYNLYFHDEYLGIPAHPKHEEAESTLAMILTWRVSHYTQNQDGQLKDKVVRVAFDQMNSPWAEYPSFDDFWKYVNSLWVIKTGAEVRIPEKTKWTVGLYTAKTTQTSSHSTCESNECKSNNLKILEAGPLSTSTTQQLPLNRCQTNDYENFPALILRAKSETR